MAAGNGDRYTTTTFSIFPDLLPPPGPEFCIPAPTNIEPTSAERWLRFRRSFSQNDGPIVPPETQSVHPSGPGTGTGTCPICRSPFDEPTTTKCGHIFCKMCITGALKREKKCPICRNRLTKRDTMIRVYLP